MNPFAERYKTYTTIDLLRIIETPADYQPLAVKAAQEELTARNLSEQELEDEKAELENEKLEIIRKKEKRKALEDNIKEKGSVVADYLNPIQQSKPGADKLIISISLVFILISIIQIATQYELILLFFSEPLSEWDFSVPLFLYPMVMGLVSSILFLRRLRIGWILFAVFLCSMIAGLLFTLITTYFAAEYLLVVLFYGAALWTVCSKKVSDIYHISKRTIATTLILTFAISTLIMGIGFYS